MRGTEPALDSCACRPTGLRFEVDSLGFWVLNPKRFKADDHCMQLYIARAMFAPMNTGSRLGSVLRGEMSRGDVWRVVSCSTMHGS